MSPLTESDIDCPYCGEAITVLVDESAGDQRYIEDCQVCCRPIEIQVRLEGGQLFGLDIRREDDA